MKKIIALTMAALLALALCACGAAPAAPASSASAAASASASSGEQTALPTVEAGKLHMSTNAAFPPYEMVADNGAFEGIDVEVAGAIAEKLGLELVVDDMGFDAALQAAQTGKSDIVMAGVSVTEARKEVMDFTDSYTTAVQVIIVTEDSAIATVDDLANASMIGCQVATTGYIYCSDDYGEDKVTAFDNGAAAVMALQNGQVDAVVIDSAPAEEFVKANTGLKILDTEYVEEEYAIGLAKGSALTVAINDAMNELKEDGTLQSIIDKYITAE